MSDARLLLCTDLDRTLLPNGRQEESPRARERFARFVAQPGITLAYVSGRHPALVEEAIAAYAIPRPDWLIADVGTTLHRAVPGGWETQNAWQDLIGADWQGRTAADLEPLFTDLAALTLQEPARQGRHKLSYHVPLDADIAALQLEMRERLNRRGLAASLIHSLDEEAGIGLLDVLPERATKLEAVEFLMRREGFAPSHTVFAGDSGNDLPVLSSVLPAVLVANAHPDTIARARFESRRNGTDPQLYLARGGFLGMNGNYAAGILEGIAHFHPPLAEGMA
jgi:HAD superfamily hydrolase (TIGR01484 family)